MRIVGAAKLDLSRVVPHRPFLRTVDIDNPEQGELQLILTYVAAAASKAAASGTLDESLWRRHPLTLRETHIPEDATQKSAMAQMKLALARIANVYANYANRFSGLAPGPRVTLSGLHTFCERVTLDLYAAFVASQTLRRARGRGASEVAVVLDSLLTTEKRLLALCVGREDVKRAILDYVKSKETIFLAFGASGSGKSAFVATLARDSAAEMGGGWEAVRVMATACFVRVTMHTLLVGGRGHLKSNSAGVFYRRR